MVSAHLSGMSRCSIVQQLPGAQELQALPTGSGRAGASAARAHPTTPSKGAGQAKEGRQLVAAYRPDHQKCLRCRGRSEVKLGSESVGEG